MEAKKIIVVDDDALLSKTIDICLSKRGHEVKVFYNGVDAVRHLFNEKPDLMVLDIKLPDCNGWFITRLLEKLEWAEEIPVVVISVLEPDRRKVTETKLFAYIQKPFDMGQLTQTIEKSLGEQAPLIGA
jgi:DNA-binding response OmpR family regulator